MKHLGIALSLSLLLSACSETEIIGMSQLDLARDLCLYEAYDKLETGDVHGTVNLSPFSLKHARDPSGAAFLVELGALMSAHNKKAADTTREYILHVKPPGSLRGYRPRALGNGTICLTGPDIDRKNRPCRNRNFWMFKEIAPELNARIIFDNTVAKQSDLRSCYDFPWLIRRQPR